MLNVAVRKETARLYKVKYDTKLHHKNMIPTLTDQKATVFFSYGYLSLSI
jgi:hypothetical protein